MTYIRQPLSHCSKFLLECVEEGSSDCSDMYERTYVCAYVYVCTCVVRGRGKMVEEEFVELYSHSCVVWCGVVCHVHAYIHTLLFEYSSRCFLSLA